MILQDKTALITGASRGIGKAIALEFARQGVTRLLLIARSQNSLEEVKTTIHHSNPNVEVITISLDLTQTFKIKEIIPRILLDYAPIDILVNNAGVAHQADFLSSKLEEFEDEINLNLRGTFAITRLLAQYMVKQRSGIIVNVSSLMGKLAAPSYSTYSATKFALLGLTQSLRMELANYNVRVVALLPTLTTTDMLQGATKFELVVPSSPETVAIALVKGLRTGKTEILVGWQSKLAIFTSYIAPWLVESAIRLSEFLGRHSTTPKIVGTDYQDCCNTQPKLSA